MDDENNKEYRWETGYEKTWEVIQEDEKGYVADSINEIQRNKFKKKRLLKRDVINRIGMIRYLYVLLDCTENMDTADYKPTRMKCCVKILEIFINEFFDQNPISNLGIIALKNKRSEVLTELLSNNKKHLKAMEGLKKVNLSGEPSLQNGLDIAIKSLKNVPPHASREILVIIGSLTTCDPGDLFSTIQELKSLNIRVSFVSLSAEVFIYKTMCKETLGEFNAALDDSDLKEKLLSHIEPPSSSNGQTFSLIKMGFPCNQTSSKSNVNLALCSCHVNSGEESVKFNLHGYSCPQCESKYCEIPTECNECGLTLVSAPHLARSYHHLFPIKTFREEPVSDALELCFACQKSMKPDVDKFQYVCENCARKFCLDCDLYIHDVIHVCIGCSTSINLAGNGKKNY